MVFGANQGLPPYLLGAWPWKVRHALVTPATRWRVFIEDQEPVEHDVILNTVLRIRQAGETDAARIADSLQLPEPLIRYLLATANHERLDASRSGRGIVAMRSTVGWVYRDAATGELWPQAGEQMEPLEIRFSGSFRGRFDSGTAGRRTTIDALLLDSREAGNLEPTAVELARFSQSDEARKRTAVISSGEPCLVVSPVTKDPSGLAVLTTQETPHQSLGRLLNTAVDQHESVANWAKAIPAASVQERKSSLALALDELDESLQHLRVGEFRTLAASHLNALIDLALGRWVDHYRLQAGLAAPDARLTNDDCRTVADSYGLGANVAVRWASGPKSDSRRKVIELLAARLRSADPRIRDLSVVAARYDSIVVSGSPPQELVELAWQMAHLGQLLLSEEGSSHGQAEG